ncbi:MAG TPA: amino acid permease [Steroidobacteraceae bacterium]|nr:amino acid permease [Steroidobacteraceae bacterium]
MQEARGLSRDLGLLPAIAVNVGNMIGTGIFLKPRVMTCNVGAASTVIAAWVLGALLTLLGAFAYSEIAALLPEAGGEYAYVRRAYGRLTSFLCGWALFALPKCGAQAALALGFAIFMNVATGGALARPVFAFTLLGHQISLTLLTPVAVASIWAVVLINARSVTRGGQTALGLTAFKVGFLLSLALAALLFGHGTAAHFGQSNQGGLCEGVAATARGGGAGFGAAVLGALWAYNGWSNVAPLIGELRSPERNVPRVFIGGMLVTGILYVLVTVSFFYVLSPTEIASVAPTSSVATEVLRRFVGPVAVTVLACVLMLSAFAAHQANALAGARIGFAMARDGLFFRPLAKVSAGTRAPVNALLAQASFATVLAIAGTFDALTDTAMFGGWLVYGVAASTVFVFRRTAPDAPRPYRCAGYPVLPAMFVLLVAGIVINTFIATPRQALLGAGIIALGLPFYCFWGLPMASHGKPR